MKIIKDGQNYECFLLDDGTLDTVVEVNGIQSRYDGEYVTRKKDGSISARELRRLFESAIDDYGDEKAYNASLPIAI